MNSSSLCSATLGSKIFLSMSPLILFFGTFTNILSLLVLSRKKMRKHSTYVYLAILSVIDLMALWLGLMRDYLAHGYGIYIQSTWLCKMHTFMFYYSLDLSSWILVAVSLDRFFAITFVFSSYTRQLVLKFLSKPKMICSIICILLLVLNSHFVYFVQVDSDKNDLPINNLESILRRGINTNSSQHKSRKQHSIGVAGEYYFCVIDEGNHPLYVNFFLNYWPYIDLSAYAILPFCVMFVCNISIIKNAKFNTKPNKPEKLKKNKPDLDHTMSDNVSDKNCFNRKCFSKSEKVETSEILNEKQRQLVTNLPRKSFQMLNNRPVTSLSYSANSTFLSSTNLSQSRNIKMMTLTIITITCLFIVLTLPIMLFIIFDKLGSSYEESLDKGSRPDLVLLRKFFFNLNSNCKSVLWSLVNMFMYTNHSINFVLYCLTGSKFRTELASLFASRQALMNSKSLNNTNVIENVQYSMPFRKYSQAGLSPVNVNFSRNNECNCPHFNDCKSNSNKYKQGRSQSIFVQSRKHLDV